MLSKEIFNKTSSFALFASVGAWAGEQAEIISVSPFTHYAAAVGLVILVISAMDKALDLYMKWRDFRKI